ncbi:unnamed protein product [Echinostoma caproni]|uniref:Uncharacterized protein n=1 Tax=Echinostoma caproni TaxID=27848 RepID=A0A183B4X9_9TREM|nr:unnamed protein product [Echinostoma caproni]
MFPNSGYRGHRPNVNHSGYTHLPPDGLLRQNPYPDHVYNGTFGSQMPELHWHPEVFQWDLPYHPSNWSPQVDATRPPYGPNQSYGQNLNFVPPHRPRSQQFVGRYPSHGQRAPFSRQRAPFHSNHRGHFDPIHPSRGASGSFYRAPVSQTNTVSTSSRRANAGVMPRSGRGRRFRGNPGTATPTTQSSARNKAEITESPTRSDTPDTTSTEHQFHDAAVVQTAEEEHSNLRGESKFP